MAGVGKVFVAVVADTRGFREDVKKLLTSLEQTAKLSIKLGLDSEKFKSELATIHSEAQANLDRNRVQLPVDADTTKAAAQIDELTRDRKVDITANVDSNGLKAKLKTLAASSAQKVDVKPEVNLAALTKAKASLATLGKVGGATGGIGALGALALSSSAGILSMASALTVLSALAVPLPGILLASGAAIATLVVALKGAGTQLKSLDPLWKKLGATIQDNFWAKAKKPILDLVNSVFPQLKSALGGVSSSLGSFVGSVATSFQKAFGPGVIGSITGPLMTALHNAQGGTGAFAQSIATLGGFGAQYLPALGSAFADVAKKFNGFVQAGVQSGQFTGLIRDAIGVVGQLGSVAGSAIGILGGLFKAADASGSSGLQTFASGLKSISDVVNGPTFQKGLILVFQGAAAGAAGLGKALAPVGALFSTLAPVISGALATLGGTAGQLISGIANALNTPVVAAGLTAAIDGISQGIQGLLPALPGIAAALGPVLTLFGQLAAQLGPVIGAALQAVAPLFGALATALTPVVAAVGPALVQVFTMLAPIFTQLAAQLGPIAQALLPAFMSVITALVPAIAPLLSIIGPLVTALLPLFTTVLTALMPIVQAVAPIIAALAPVLLSIVQALAGALIPVFQQLTPIITAVIGAIVPIIRSLATIILGVINVITGILSGNWAQAWSGAQQIVSGAVGVIVGVIRGIVSIAASVFGAVQSSIGRALTTIGSAVSGLKNIVVGAVKGAGSWLLSIGADIVNGLKNGISNAWSNVTSLVKGLTDKLPAIVRKALGIHSPSTVFAALGRYVVQGFAQGITGSQKQVASAMQTLANKVVDAYNTTGVTRTLLKAATATRAAVYSHLTGTTRAISASQRDAVLNLESQTNAKLQGLARTRVAVAQRLTVANKALVAAQKVQSDYQAKVAQSLTTVDVSKYSSGASAIKALTTQISQLQQYTTVLGQLRKAGLDDTSYQQFIAAGVSALPQAKGLLASGATAVKQVAALQGQLAKQSTSFAATAAQQLYGAGVNAARGLVDGLKSQQAAITKQMNAIAASMVASIKRALGIHSPSRVFRDEVGLQITRGLVQGVGLGRGSVNSAMAGLVRLPQLDAGTLSVGGSQAGGGTTNNWTINQVTDPVGTAQAVLRRQARYGV